MQAHADLGCSFALPQHPPLLSQAQSTIAQPPDSANCPVQPRAVAKALAAAAAARPPAPSMADEAGGAAAYDQEVQLERLFHNLSKGFQVGACGPRRSPLDPAGSPVKPLG